MSSSDPAQAAFNKAIREFRAGLKDPALYSEILATTSIDQVYDLTDQLQAVQGKGGHLQNLARVQVYLERMAAYTNVIDTFVSAKPDILALIWGPIKLLIQWTSTLTKSLDALIGTLEEIGILLPEFDHAAKLFGNKRHISQVLALLFQDMLDFYLVSLKFFRMERWKSFFEALWPKRKEEIEGVISRMKDHTFYLRNEVRLQDIEDAYEARQSDIENFAKLEESNRRQEYSALETALAPVFCGKKLVFFLTRLCDGTGDWLIRNEDMSKWLKVTKDSPKLIWLCGIPGAGKTYLSACTIKESKTHGATIFAFLSHEQHDMSALSVMHSLIFQLARKDPMLQDMVRHADRDTLEINMSATVNLFINLIGGTGPVRIIIDGLDEIDETERFLLLRQILKVSSECDQARVLIASRPEGDIKAALEKTARCIRVDTQNTQGIHSFVMSRCKEWLQPRSFSREDAREIESLMEAIAHQAKGMFLYAHLVLKGLDFVHSVSEIRRDLKVLPRDLNAAYGRIFARINQGLPNQAAREKARKALGWIGCSPVPLTIRELEQALAIQIGNLDQNPTGISNLDLGRLCGPVVEEMDGMLHLIHFTAKEYFFSPSIENSLDPAQCILSLAQCCITYLCQHHHDNTRCTDDDLFQTNVLAGIYRLHHFASENWSRLVESYLRVAPETDDQADLTQLIALLDLLAIRGHEQYLQPENRAEYQILERLRTESGHSAYELVSNELQFHQEASTRLFELGKGAWQVADPLRVRFTTASLHTTLGGLSCPPRNHQEPCYCEVIHRHYGHPFKCNFLGCERQRLGFETLKDRQRHSKTHDRQWTCQILDCEYHTIGFISRQMRDRHLDNAHRVDEALEPAMGAVISKNDKVLTLKALVRSNRFTANNSAKQMFDSLSFDDRSEVVQEVGSHGTLELMDFLLLKSLFETRQRYPDRCMGAAIERPNFQVLKWFRNVPPPIYREYYASNAWGRFLKTSDPESIYPYVENWIYAITVGSDPNFSSQVYAPVCFNHSEIMSTNDDMQETMVLKLWDRISRSHTIPTKFWYIVLCIVARSTCSIRLAVWLCEHGAAVDYLESARTGPPLVLAARRNTLASAKLIRFLLHKGADPECTARTPTSSKEPMSKLAGPTVQQWLGILWEELVEEAKEARRNNNNPPLLID